MRSAISSYALEAGSARLLPSRSSMFTRTPERTWRDDLGRHFLKREGALIRYPCAFVHFFTEFLSACTHAERNRRRSRIVAAPNCVLKLMVAAASIRSYTVTM